MAATRKLALTACLSVALAGCSAGPSETPLRSQFGGTEPGVMSLTESEAERSPAPVETTTPSQLPTR